MKDVDFKIGDKVIVAQDNKQNYRPDLEIRTIVDIKTTPKMKSYIFDDGGIVRSTNKIFKYLGKE